MRPYLKKTPTQKRAGGVAQGVSPEFKPQYGKKKNFSLMHFQFSDKLCTYHSNEASGAENS
jgi:hypothetical protein